MKLTPIYQEILKERAFHGSPATFDCFKMEKIGEGEGNDVFGWGLYFTDSRDIAEWYTVHFPISHIN